jgi:hypothetical protein
MDSEIKRRLRPLWIHAPLLALGEATFVTFTCSAFCNFISLIQTGFRVRSDWLFFGHSQSNGRPLHRSARRNHCTNVTSPA